MEAEKAKKRRADANLAAAKENEKVDAACESMRKDAMDDVNKKMEGAKARE